MSVTAKVIVSSKVEQGDQVIVSFAADYADGRNKEWAKYTPGLSLTMGLKPEVAEQFEQGQAYTLTFDKEGTDMDALLERTTDTGEVLTVQGRRVTGTAEDWQKYPLPKFKGGVVRSVALNDLSNRVHLAQLQFEGIN